MLIKWTVIWGMEYSMGRSPETCVYAGDVCLRRSISRKSRRRGGTGARGRAFSFYFEKKKKKMSHFALSKRKTGGKEIGIARDKA